MTFTEAAEAVLRKTGKPLHYKKITQLAIEQNLLSHVGKTPEVTMSTRLATLAKKDRGEAAIVRVKPGIFGLRDWGAAAADATEEGETDEPTNGEAVASGREDVSQPDEDEVIAPSSLEERERAQRLVAAANLFPEEADDNEPVMADKPAPVVAAPPATAAGEPGGDVRRRRRRRRRGRGGERAEGGPGSAQGELGVEGAADADSEDSGDDFMTPEEVAEEAAREGGIEGGAGSEGEVRASAEGVPVLSGDETTGGEPVPARGGVWRDGRRDERPRDDRGGREERPRGGDDRGGARDERSRDERARDDRAARDDRRVDDGRDANMREEIGRDAADLLVSMLTRREDRQPMPLRAIVDDAIRAGKISGEPSLLMPTLAAAARADAVRREARGERPRLRIANGRVGLIDWALGPDLVRAEADALASLERLRDAARRQLIRRLNELPQSSFTELVVLLLERMGISSLRTARRAGLPQGEIHLAGIARRANEEIKVAVLIKRGGEVGRERVIELRGSLHHYGPAIGSWIITTGNVLSGAREEATQAGTAPVALIDGVGLGRLFDEYAVGVKHAHVSIPYVDLDLFDALRST